MRRILLIFSLFHFICQGQSFLGQGYLGFGSQMGYVSSSFHPMGVEFGLRSYYLVKNRYGVGSTVGIWNYAEKSELQRYEFNGHTTQTNVNLTATLFTAGFSFQVFPYPLQARYEFNPYLMAEFLYVDNTVSLTIEDPNDPYGCVPIESEVVYFNNTWGLGFGIGNLLFPFKGNRNIGISVECDYQIGGNVDFVDIHQEWSSSENGIASNGISAQFRNLQSGEVHSHRIGTVYSALLRRLQGRVGVWYFFH